MSEQITTEVIIGNLCASVTIPEPQQLIDLDDSSKNSEQVMRIDEDLLENSLKCNICKEIFNEPVTLLCNHTYCYSCLIGMKKTNYYVYKKCPLCDAKIWLPPNHTVNYTLRDVIIATFGREFYDNEKENRKKSIIKSEMKDEIKNEIKDEMWRTILSTLKPPVDKNENPINGNKKFTGQTTIHEQEKDICADFNTIGGCKKINCQDLHEYNLQMLKPEFEDLKENYGYLFPN